MPVSGGDATYEQRTKRKPGGLPARFFCDCIHPALDSAPLQSQAQDSPFASGQHWRFAYLFYVFCLRRNRGKHPHKLSWPVDARGMAAYNRFADRRTKVRRSAALIWNRTISVSIGPVQCSNPQQSYLFRYPGAPAPPGAGRNHKRSRKEKRTPYVQSQSRHCHR